jgi:transcriptional regulator with XRE-family HTH domain
MASPESDDDRPSKRLGRKLREARIAAGYRNQQEFGAAMNMHRTTVTKIESGARQVGSDVLRQWCELCHVDFEGEAPVAVAEVLDAAEPDSSSVSSPGPAQAAM